MSSIDQNPNEEPEQHDITELVQRIETLETTRLEVEKAIQALSGTVKDLEDSLDLLCEKF